MFIVDEPVIAYHDPWNVPFEQRMAWLRTGERRILYLYEAPDNSTFRYRAYNMVEAWKGVPGVGATYAFYADLPRLMDLPYAIDAVVICRCRYTHTLAEFVAVQRQRGARVVFDVDDLIFSPAHAHLIVNTLDQDLGHPSLWDVWHAITSRLHETLRLCDGAIVTNAFLAAQVMAAFDIPTAIIPNGLNAMQIGLSDRLFAGKLEKSFARAVDFQIGYFSGTPSHEKDFAIAESAIASVMERHSEVRLRVVGFLKERERFKRFRGRIEYYPLHDFMNLQRLMAYSEVNIVPLQENVFTNCKSELKYFEAAIVGTPTIATPTYTYGKAIRPGETGLLALAHEWEAALESLIGDLPALRRMASSAREEVRVRYAPAAQLEQMQAAFFGSGGFLA